MTHSVILKLPHRLATRIRRLNLRTLIGHKDLMRRTAQFSITEALLDLSALFALF